MQIEKIRINDFTPQAEYGGGDFSTENETTLIYGQNNSGKTTTFCATGYAVVRKKWGKKTGRNFDISVLFSNGIEYELSGSGYRLTIGQDTYEGKEDTESKLHERIGAKRLLRYNFVHSQSSKLRLEKTSEDVLTHVREVVAPEINKEISDIVDRRRELKDEINEIEQQIQEIENHVPRIDDRIQQIETDIEVEERIVRLRESGDLSAIRDTLEEHDEINQNLQQLYEQREKVDNELATLRNQRDSTENGGTIRKDAVKAINRTCTLCETSVPAAEARNRVSAGVCPLCSRDTEFFLPNVGTSSKEDNESIDEKIADREAELRTVEEQIAQIKSNRTELSELDEDVQDRLQRHDKNVESVAQTAQAEIAKLEEQAASVKNQREQLVTQREEIEQRLPTLKDELQDVEQAHRQKQEEARDAIEEFENRCEEIFRDMSSNLGSAIRLRGDQGLVLPGQPNRVYGENDHPGEAQGMLLNLSFGITLHEMDTENKISLDTFVLDDPFVHLEDAGKEELLEFILNDDERQYIITTSDDSVKQRIDNVEILEIQTNLDMFAN